MADKEKEEYLKRRASQVLDGLKKERLERGWSIHRMAQELDMDRGYLYRIESGAVSLGLKNLIALCDKMGLEVRIVKPETASGSEKEMEL